MSAVIVIVIPSVPPLPKCVSLFINSSVHQEPSGRFFERSHSVRGVLYGMISFDIWAFCWSALPRQCLTYCTPLYIQDLLVTSNRRVGCCSARLKTDKPSLDSTQLHPKRPRIGWDVSATGPLVPTRPSFLYRLVLYGIHHEHGYCTPPLYTTFVHVQRQSLFHRGQILLPEVVHE